MSLTVEEPFISGPDYQPERLGQMKQLRSRRGPVPSSRPAIIERPAFYQPTLPAFDLEIWPAAPAAPLSALLLPELASLLVSVAGGDSPSAPRALSDTEERHTFGAHAASNRRRAPLTPTLTNNNNGTRGSLPELFALQNGQNETEN